MAGEHRPADQPAQGRSGGIERHAGQERTDSAVDIHTGRVGAREAHAHARRSRVPLLRVRHPESLCALPVARFASQLIKRQAGWEAMQVPVSVHLYVGL